MAKIRSIVKPFPPVRKLHWKKRKTLAALDNRKQREREFDPYISSGLEIVSEAGDTFITESSSSANPIYYITE